MLHRTCKSRMRDEPCTRRNPAMPCNPHASRANRSCDPASGHPRGQNSAFAAQPDLLDIFCGHFEILTKKYFCELRRGLTFAGNCERVRAGWNRCSEMDTYSDRLPSGVSFELSARPSIQPNHIDGPLLVFRDGQLHWLTWLERLQFWLGMTDAAMIERKRRPNLVRIVEGK